MPRTTAAARRAEPAHGTPLDEVSDRELERVADSLVALLLSAARNLGVIDWGPTEPARSSRTSGAARP